MQVGCDEGAWTASSRRGGEARLVGKDRRPAAATGGIRTQRRAALLSEVVTVDGL